MIMKEYIINNKQHNNLIFNIYVILFDYIIYLKRKIFIKITNK